MTDLFKSDVGPVKGPDPEFLTPVFQDAVPIWGPPFAAMPMPTTQQSVSNIRPPVGNAKRPSRG